MKTHLNIHAFGRLNRDTPEHTHTQCLSYLQRNLFTHSVFLSLSLFPFLSLCLCHTHTHYWLKEGLSTSRLQLGPLARPDVFDFLFTHTHTHTHTRNDAPGDPAADSLPSTAVMISAVGQLLIRKQRVRVTHTALLPNPGPVKRAHTQSC